MTELQILRNALFDELKRAKQGTTTSEDTKQIVSISNAVIQSFNTELKAFELLCKAQEVGTDTKMVQIFNNDDKKVIDYIAKD